MKGIAASMRDLRVRLGFILAMALLPLLVFSVWKSYSDYNRDQALLSSNTDLAARFALTEIVNSFDTTKSILRFTSTLLADEGCKADLQRLTEKYPRFYNIIEADAEGKIECSAKPVRSSPQQAAKLLSKLSNDVPFVTGVFNFPNSNGAPVKVIATAHGIFTDGKMTKVFVAVEDINYLLGLLEKSKILEESELAVFNESGEVLGGDWNSGNLQAIANSFPSKDLDSKSILEDEDGRSVLVLSTPADDIYLAVTTDGKKNTAGENFNPITYAALPILAWLFGFAAIWLSTDQLILVHIRRMRRAALGFAKGDRDARVGKLVNPPAAIHALGKNFDQMADRIVEREATIQDSLDEKETLLREIHHRVKNNLQIIISLLNMQERKLKDKDGLEAITETKARINAIALVHRGLYESTDLRVVDMQKFLSRLLPELSLALGLKKRKISISTQANCNPMEADTATPVALFIVEALTNAVKHGVPRGGEISIYVSQKGSDVTVSVTDNGTTSNESQIAENGTGTKLMKGFARQLGGILKKEADENGYNVTLNFTPRTSEPLI